MVKLQAFKEKVSQLRATMQNFKSHHKTADMAISYFIDELPFPFRTFAKITWKGLESEREGSVKMLTILERIADTTNEEFDRLVKLLDELINKQAATEVELIQIGKEILDQDKKMLDLVIMKINSLDKVTDETYLNTKKILNRLDEIHYTKSNSDYDIFLGYRVVFDRPAFKRPYTWHSSIDDFNKAITDTIRAVNTGRHITRHGFELAQVKPKTFIKNKIWRDKMDIVEDELSHIVQLNYSLKESLVSRDEIPLVIDSSRDHIIYVLNSIWDELDIPNLPVPSQYQEWNDTKRPLWDWRCLFKNSIFYNSVNKVREFMFNDIEKTISLVNNSQLGAPNFLLALGLCCFTEYWGRLLVGIATRKGNICFNTFFDRLGQPYVKVRNNKDEIYYRVRCGLVHSYLVEGSVIDMQSGLPCGVEYDDQTTQYAFHVRTYFEHFKNAVNDYIQGLDDGTENLTLMEQALENKAELV